MNGMTVRQFVTQLLHATDDLDKEMQIRIQHRDSDNCGTGYQLVPVVFIGIGGLPWIENNNIVDAERLNN